MRAPTESDKSNLMETMKKLVVVTILMFGFGFALVPIYRVICEVTGINQVVKKDDAPTNTQIDTSRKITIEFDSNTNHLPWRFKPVVNSVTVHPGELVHVDYEVVNAQDRAMHGQAIPSYAPKNSTKHFKKLECFCFKQQVLQAHESKKFPVVFVIDPALPKDVTTITLSYTFFEVAGKG
jgi:cytochrome c oxidase assembly protein subunit 11